MCYSNPENVLLGGGWKVILKLKEVSDLILLCTIVA